MTRGHLIWRFMLASCADLAPKTADQLGKIAAAIISRGRRSKYVRAVRVNQWVLSGRRMSAVQLDRAVQAVFRHSACCLYDLYYHTQKPDLPEDLVVLSPSTATLVERSLRGEGGAVVVFPHLSNYYLMLYAVVRYGLETQVLSFPHPTIKRQLQNYIQSKTGAQIDPISPSSLLRAAKRLKSGGTVAGAVDVRDVNEENLYRLSFFGQLARLPVYHVRLAQVSDVPIYVVACYRRADDTYFVETSPPIRMRMHNDRFTRTRINAERVLRTIEGFIERAPRQWRMYYPVWPEAYESMP